MLQSAPLKWQIFGTNCEYLIMKRKILLLTVILLISCPPAFPAADSEWEIIPAIHRINELIRVDNDLWGATNSGLFRFDLESGSFEVFTTAHGLSSMQIESMTLDERGNLILGMGNAYVDVFNLETHQCTRLSDFKMNTKIFSIYALHSYDGEVFVGTDIGVSRLVYFEDIGRYLIEGNYVTLGNFPTEITAEAIHVYDGGLWVGTEDGLARGDLSLPYLESPESWTNYTTSSGLSDNDVSALEVFRDTLYIAARNASYGLNRMISLSQGFETINFGASSNIEFLKAHNDTLYLGRFFGVYRIVGDEIQRFGETDAKALCLEFEADGSMWAGTDLTRLSTANTRLGGLKSWNGEAWIIHAVEGALVETVTDVLVQDDGSLWVTGQLDLGYGNGVLCHFDGIHWINLGRQYENYELTNQSVSPDSFFWYRTRQITEDHNGDVWISSDGRGVGWFEFAGDSIQSKGYYTTTTGHLFNIDSYSHYCVVRDLLTDRWGNIWICNSEADMNESGDRPIAVVPTDFIEDPVAYPNWYYLRMKEESGASLQYSAFYVDRIEEDSYGRKWFGGNNNTGDDKGVWVLDDNDTPISDLDDQWTHITGLPSDSITTIVTDRDGIVWVGTPAGVQYFYPDENAQYLAGNRVDLYGLPSGAGVNVIAVDPQNNKWFGTNQGVSILASDNFTWLDTYTDIDGSFPSPLPGGVVQAIAFNPVTGEAYLGTDKGLARLQTPYKQMGSSVTEISIITDSNPFLIGDGSGARLHFDASGLSETTAMKIFTAAGFLVRELTKNEIILGWDGRNLRGELVGSGIYLLLAYDPDGNAEVGKVAVIHR